jgi:hypothetical protein
MIKYCLEKWDKNKQALEKALTCDKELMTCDYKHLVELVVKHILNDSQKVGDWNLENIVEIDNGNYQGTLLYVFHGCDYQPAEYDYLMTYVEYGSCSSCDILQRIQCFNDDIKVHIKDFMTLCRDIVSHIVKPYNTGWRNQEEYMPVE